MLLDAGADQGIVEYGFNALLSLRLEKSYGIWSAEFTQGYTPGMTGMDRWIDWNREAFIGREAALVQRDEDGRRRVGRVARARRGERLSVPNIVDGLNQRAQPRLQRAVGPRHVAQRGVEQRHKRSALERHTPRAHFADELDYRGAPVAAVHAGRRQ